jgi:hypothetical protein
MNNCNVVSTTLENYSDSKAFYVMPVVTNSRSFELFLVRSRFLKIKGLLLLLVID